MSCCFLVQFCPENCSGLKPGFILLLGPQCMFFMQTI
uniref:Uncharacterized protein n=1 Tax=Anguilla anguilla TaxID=7936 RepID=A0A0E9U7H7_ANGAN